MVYC